ncbi:hypothetical protein CDD81_4866 [Ophiocordyceps australis]|uniref:Peptidase S8/S53 domain-containing protein n=1 Tax=Ophiocordyceps australis TaxID=1399860 RepID=A0A2C5YAG6_9HYPO|nr:hypothetical protein CDD81_4866 [Ophiocordyceps australis]
MANQPPLPDDAPQPMARHIIVLKSGLKGHHLGRHLKRLKRIYQEGGSQNTSHVEISHSYFGGASGFHGYAGRFSALALEDIRRHPQVELVQEDTPVQIPRHTTKRSPSALPDKRLLNMVTQYKSSKTSTRQLLAPWNLHAISHRSPLPKLTPGCFWTYLYDSRAGDKTFAYVIDSGVRVTHVQFQGRAMHGCTINKGQAGCSNNPSDNQDLNGHGTHVAGIIAARTYGVAKQATVIAVKVFDEAGRATRSDTIEGFLWAVNDILVKNRVGAAVINISWGKSVQGSDALGAAIDRAYEKLGILTIVSAGNNAKPALDYSPACASQAITVAGVSKHWSMYKKSNFGCGVDIFAPATNIISLSNRHDSGLVTRTGTSMAAPHVAGLVLTAMSVHGKTEAAAIKHYLYQTATRDRITGDLQGVENRLANNNDAKQTSSHESGCLNIHN